MDDDFILPIGFGLLVFAAVLLAFVAADNEPKVSYDESVVCSHDLGVQFLKDAPTKSDEINTVLNSYALQLEEPNAFENTSENADNTIWGSSDAFCESLTSELIEAISEKR